MFNSIAVLGPGLLGGSILKAVRKFLPKCELRIWARRLSVLHYAREHDLADYCASDLQKVVYGAELIILTTPIQYMREVVAGFPVLAKDVIVTDVGSTKGSVVNSIVEPIKQLGGLFIGSHPMAGSEKTGIEHAQEDLFCEASVIVTPVDVDNIQVQRLSDFWTALGGVVTCMTPGEHDQVVAAISHLPHLVAASLVRSVLGTSLKKASFSGNGFRDTTRIAGGDPEMWAEIMLANRSAIVSELGKLIAELGSWQEALVKSDKDSIHRFLSEAKQSRDQL